jgi:hypothetical protein
MFDLQNELDLENSSSLCSAETGSWNGIDLNLRKCTLCNSSGSIGDEFHYLFALNAMNYLY